MGIAFDRVGRAKRLGAAALAALALSAAGSRAARAGASWESAIATLQTAPASGWTIRQFARISIGGGRLRIRLSNASGTEPLSIADVHVALPGSAPGSVDPSSDRLVTFSGGRTTRVAPGASALSDPVDMPVQPLTRLAVSGLFTSRSPLQVGRLSSGETSYLAPGDRSADASMAGARTTDSAFYLAGITVDTDGAAVACLGDSITAGLFSTIDAEKRYPDRLAERLLGATRGRVGTLDAGIAGNSLLQGSPTSLVGESAVARLGRDVLERPGVRWMILFQGINDIIFPPDAGDTGSEIVSAYREIIARAHERGVEVFGATLTPFSGAGRDYYSPAKERVREAVNAWIRTSGAFDAVLDFDAVVRDPGQPLRLRPAYDSDHLHLNDAGYAAIADSIPLGLFR